MKATRKLIPAIAMLLISAVMMSTATFAWFSTNSTVQANGMTVSAKSANTFLVISKTGTNYTTEGKVSTTTAAKAIIPAKATSTGSALTWQTGKSIDPGSPTLSGDYSPIDSGALSNYVVVDEFYISVLENFIPGEDLVCSVIAKTGDSVFTDAVSVAIVCEGFDKDDSGEITTATTTSAVYVDGKVSEESNPVLSEWVTSGKNVKITVYVYINGDNAKVFTNNTMTDKALENIKVDLTFAVK